MTTLAERRGRRGSLARLAASAHQLFNQHRLLRFLIVGGFNTAFGYFSFLVALAILPTTFLALCASTIVAVLFNFVSTGSYVFHSVDPRRLISFVAVYGVVFAYNAVGLSVLKSLAIVPQLGGLMLLPGAVAISYLLNSRYVFGRP